MFRLDCPPLGLGPGGRAGLVLRARDSERTALPGQRPAREAGSDEMVSVLPPRASWGRGGFLLCLLFRGFLVPGGDIVEITFLKGKGNRRSLGVCQLRPSAGAGRCLDTHFFF